MAALGNFSSEPVGFIRSYDTDDNIIDDMLLNHPLKTITALFLTNEVNIRADFQFKIQ